MATMGSIQVAGKALVGQGGNGKGRKGRVAGLVATAALGLSLVVGGLAIQGRRDAQQPQASANPFAGDTHVYTVWDFREDRRVGAAPASGLDWEQRERTQVAPGPADGFVPGPFTYREDRRAETRDYQPSPRVDWQTSWFLEQNQLPDVTGPPPGACLPGEAGPCVR